MANPSEHAAAVSESAERMLVEWAETLDRLAAPPGGAGVTVDDVRRVAAALPRTEERLVRDRVTFRVGRLVYVTVSADETLMGFAFPKEEREALVAAEPERYLMPRESDLRYNWVRARLAGLDHHLLDELVVDAWRLVVPKRVAAAYLAGGGMPAPPQK